MTTNIVSKFHQNPSRSVKWFLYNSLHIYRELLLTSTAYFDALYSTKWLFHKTFGQGIVVDVVSLDELSHADTAQSIP